jgi:hypothetical protein
MIHYFPFCQRGESVGKEGKGKGKGEGRTGRAGDGGKRRRGKGDVGRTEGKKWR